MLKIMQSHKFFTVFVLGAITVMITIAFVFWGIGPKDNPQMSFVADIEGDKITLDQYWRAYDNEYDRLRKQYDDPKEIEKLNLKERIISRLVDRTVLLIAAREAGVTVTERELQQAIIEMPYFQRNGVFDQSVYMRALKLNRTSPQAFELGLMNDIIAMKMSRLIGETAELSAEEQKMLDSIKGDKQQLTDVFLSSKTNQAVKAYIESFKRKLDIKVNREAV